MKPDPEKRRRFIRTSLAIPLLGSFGVRPVLAQSEQHTFFAVPDAIYHKLFELYGGDANSILTTDRIKLQLPAIAENSAVVGLSLTGEKGYVSDFAIFVEQNPDPLSVHGRVYPATDLLVGTRIKVRTTSNIYAIARTADGLVGVKELVKVTIGCGGA